MVGRVIMLAAGQASRPARVSGIRCIGSGCADLWQSGWMQ